MSSTPMPHQMMGYDRAITMFSPDGRLLQVEYAKTTVKKGSAAIGIECKDGVVLVTDKRLISTLVVPDAVEKIFKVDDHIATTGSGILSDARVLAEMSQLKAQQHRVTYDTPIDILSIVKGICDLLQITTQSGGYRPFGVGMIVAGIDQDGAKLFETDPTGIFFQYKAIAIGEGDEEINKILEKEWNENLTIEDGIKLAISAMKRVVKDLAVERVDCVYINKKDKKFAKLDKKELQKYLKK